VFPALLPVALTAEPHEEPTISDILASGTTEPLAEVFSLLLRGDALAEARAWDFRLKFADVGVAVLRVMPRPGLVRYAIALCKRKPAVFAGIPVFASRFGMEVLHSVGNATLAAMLSSCAMEAQPAYGLAPLFHDLFYPEREPVRLSGDELNFLFS
jgi:hypothetical protein